MKPHLQFAPIGSRRIALPALPSVSTPAAELDRRLSRLRHEMVRAKIDAIVITDRNNFEYLTDFRTMTWSYNARPVQALVTPEKIIVVGSTIEERNIASEPRRFESRLYRGYAEEGARATVEAMVYSIGSHKARVAIDFGQDMLGRGSLTLVDGIRALGIELVGGSDVLWRVRMIKSRYEVELKRISLVD